MSSNELVEGECDFSYPGVGKPLKTWYRVRGELRSGARPLVALHGGPGAAHNYIQSVADLSTRYGIPVVLYDQVGCGKSTHLPDKKGDTSFWTADLFLDELRNLLQHLGIQDDYDLYGQSWGGMLAAEYAIRQPKGLHKVIIANSPSDMRTFVEEANRLRLELPQEVQDALNKHEKDGTTDSEAYEAAVMEFYARHLCRIDPMPQDMLDTLENIKRDPTVYHTMFVPSQSLACRTTTDHHPGMVRQSST